MSALNIKDKAVADMARRLAGLKGTTITEAVSAALDASLKIAEHHARIDPASGRRRVDEAIARIRGSIPADAPSWEQVMDDMYDEDGLPK